MTSADFAPKFSFPQIWGFSPKNTPCLSDVALAGIVMVQYRSISMKYTLSKRLILYLDISIGFCKDSFWFYPISSVKTRRCAGTLWMCLVFFGPMYMYCMYVCMRFDIVALRLCSCYYYAMSIFLSHNLSVIHTHSHTRTHTHTHTLCMCVCRLSNRDQVILGNSWLP